MDGWPFGDVAARNPWWVGSNGFASDPHLQLLAQAPFQRSPSALQTTRANEPNVYTLRGPRQVGKTTLLKQLASRLVREEAWDPRLVVYYPLDLADRPQQIVDLVLLARGRIRREKGEPRRYCCSRTAPSFSPPVTGSPRMGRQALSYCLPGAPSARYPAHLPEPHGYLTVASRQPYAWHRLQTRDQWARLGLLGDEEQSHHRR